MAERVLVSPGVFDREIDGTFRPAAPVGVGSAIVAPRAKGPAMVPVLLKDRDEDEQLFGVPNANGKDFGAYAARAYLKGETNPLTMVRLLGTDDTGVTPGFDIPSPGGLFAIGASGSNVVALLMASGTVAMMGTLTSSVATLAISGTGFDLTASLNRSDANYIGKVLNTDPTQYGTQKHFLIAVYDYASKTPTSNNAFFATRITAGSNWQDSFITGSTTEVISQPFGLVEYGLFGVGNKFAGSSADREWKASILNIKKSSNPAVNEYGTFTLVIRKFDDNDRNPVVLESFSNLTLDPDADNYLCKVVGDTYQVWNKTTKKFDEFGEYPSRSKYCYIIPSLDLKNGNVPETALPYGFRGYRSILSGAVSHKASFPDVPYVANLLYKSDFTTRVYWGVAVIDNGSGSLNYGVSDRIQHLNKALTLASGSVGTNFSLKWLSASVGNATAYSTTVRLTDVQVNALSSSIVYSGSTVSPAGVSGFLTLENIENTVLAKFTLPPADGYDGVNITKANPFDPANMGSTSAYETYAYRAGIDMLSNPDELELHDLALPGVHAAKVVDYAIDMVEGRGDMFYIVDVSGSSVSDVIDSVVARNFDTNYAACYYPWLKFDDTLNRKQVEVPPTVVMPAVYAYSDTVSYPWYAPAGMSRGGLSQHGVKKAKEKLTLPERNRLYENRINPIASFPGSGPVVWGQKTLQQRESALTRINVRRMLLRVRKMIAKEAVNIVFEPNVQAVWDRFVNKIEPKLENVRKNFGIVEFRIILDERTTTEDLVERNIMYGKIAIKPTRTAETILLDFFVTNSLAGFDD